MTTIDPSLLKTSALAKATQLESRVNALAVNSTTELSPVVVYLQGAVPQVSVHGDATLGGAWTCPAGITNVQVEAWGAGGGGGGGSVVNGGGGGGGGGEYALEPAYAVIPGNVYSYTVGAKGQGGVTGGQGGWTGGNTVFDISANGVVANGGVGGDVSPGMNGGTGSSNSVHFNGGNGGVSTAGIGSDLPTTLSNLQLWYVFKGSNSSNGTVSSVIDSSGHSHTGSCVNSDTSPPISSGIIATAGAAPTQAPAGSPYNAAYFKQNTSSKTPSYVVAKGFGLGKGIAAPNDGSHLTVSCWIKADTTLGSWGYLPVSGHQYVGLVSNSDFISGLHSGFSDPNSGGFALFLQNGQPGFYLNDQTIASSGRAILGTALSVTNTWHQIVGTWDGTTMKLYVDGTLSTSTTTGFTKFGPGPYGITAGVNAKTLTDSSLTGYMSNVFVTASTASAGYVTTAFGASPVTGGSGGGASGGSSGAGNNGGTATSSTGAAGGTATAAASATLGGSGAGGAGGTAPANGSPGPVTPPYGGAGGGAGTPATSAAVTLLTYSAQNCASYTGMDAAGGNAGALYSVSMPTQSGISTPYPGVSVTTENLYSGGDPSSSFNGSLNSVAIMPNINHALVGNTLNTVTCTVTVQSTSASVLPVGFGTANDIPQSLASDTDITTYLTSYTAAAMVYIPAGLAGRKVTFDLTSSGLFTALQNSTVALVFGGLQGSATHDIGTGAYNAADSFAWNTVITGAGATDPTTNITLTVEVFPSTGSNKTGGDGAPGALIISFIDTRYWPVTAIQPAATTDSDGHSFNEGITTDSIVGFDPTIVPPGPRSPENWRSLGALTGSGATISQARFRFSPMDGGTLVIQVAFVAPASWTSGSYAFANTIPTALRPTVSSTAGNDSMGYPVAPLSGTTAGSPYATLNINGQNASPNPGQVTVALGANMPAAAASRLVYVEAHIPLT